MGKWVHDDVLDASWNYIANNATRETLCSAQPTTFAEANSTYALADVTIDSGDFTIADGDTSGRKVTVAAQSGVPVDVTGTGTHIALLDVANTKLLYVTTCPSVDVTSGNNADLAAWDAEIADPT